MKKNVVIILSVVLASYFILGAYSSQSCEGRYQLKFGTVEEETYGHGSHIPETKPKRRLFKIDSDTGRVWVYNEEYRYESNRQIRRLKGFVELPVDEKFSENPYNK